MELKDIRKNSAVRLRPNYIMEILAEATGKQAVTMVEFVRRMTIPEEGRNGWTR